MWRVWVRRGGCIGSCWGNRREGDHWGDLGVDGWIILGWISRRWDVGIWTGLGWPRIETGSGRLWVRLDNKMSTGSLIQSVTIMFGNFFFILYAVPSTFLAKHRSNVIYCSRLSSYWHSGGNQNSVENSRCVEYAAEPKDKSIIHSGPRRTKSF